MSIGRDGNVWVADTHYYRVLVYSPEGKLLRTIGGTKGDEPGEFGLVTDVAQDSQGNYYVSEYGEFDRIQKFSPDGKFLLQWGGHGSEPGQFVRPQKMAIDEHDHLWVTDACNHRIQVFDTEGKLLKIWGDGGQRAGRVVLSLRHRVGRRRHRLCLRVRQPSRAEVHARRPLAGLLGQSRAASRRPVQQSLGCRARQPRD